MKLRLNRANCVMGMSLLLLGFALISLALLDLSDGAMGATFAIAAGSGLFARMIPTDGEPLRRQAEPANGLVVAVLTFLAGWYWLHGESGTTAGASVGLWGSGELFVWGVE